MVADSALRKSFRLGIGLLLLFPFLILLEQLDHWSGFDFARFLDIFLFTARQAALSAFSILTFGILGALGLIRFSELKKVETFLLVPSLVPTLFVIVACLKFFNPFPFGLVGIVLVQTVIYSGLCAVTVKTLLESKIGAWSELALIEGASKFSFLKVVLKFLRKDLLLIFLFFFSLTFSSLSVPLIAGGFTAQTLELYIYEKIHIDRDFSQAFTLSFIQSIFLLGLCWRLSQFKTPQTVKPYNTKLLGFTLGLVPITGFTVIILIGQLSDLSVGYRDFRRILAFVSLPEVLFHSLLISLGSGFFMMALLALTAYALPHRHFRSFLLSYLAPSTALMGLAWLSLDLYINTFTTLTMIIIGLSLLTLPLIYRLRFDGAFQSLSRQIEVAGLMGASWNQTYRKIILPQIWPTLCFGAALMAFWASGEFAFSSLVATSSFSLSLLTKSLADSYRIEAASLLSWLNLLLGFGVWIFFRRLKCLL